MRQIMLDTETTGLRVEDGHRIIEIACLEMINRKLTGKYYHQFINPQREVEIDALKVHGMTNEFLADKPFFDVIDHALMEFISGAELVIHNAAFDLSFLNSELALTNRDWKRIQDYCTVIDTLQLARRHHPGQRNSLDALCKRYAIDNSKRDLHGALLDANLLAQVYLMMTGGQGSFFDGLHDVPTQSVTNREMGDKTKINDSLPQIVLTATPEEQQQHKNYLALLKQQGKCIWNH